MSNGDDEAEDAAEESAETSLAASFESRLDDAAASLEAADTEAGLDGVEDTLDEIAADIDAADVPEPDEDEADAEDPLADVEERLADIRADLEEARGPYAVDVVDVVEGAAETFAESEWTEDGEADARAAVEAFLDGVAEHVAIDEDEAEERDPAEALEFVATTVGNAGLDADDDAETIEALVAIAETLETALEDAQVWSDLTVRQQLDANGFYDVLESGNRKDFPPEWNAIKVYAKRGEAEPILYALDKLGDSGFFEEYVFEQLHYLGRDAAPAFEEMHQRSQKRNKPPIRILGKIANDEACETLHEFIEGDGDPALQKVTLRALGEIGSTDSTDPVAQRLVAENAEVRSAAARSLGMIGDTRAIDPLADVLAEDDADEVRASAAWALRQIGTQRAIDEVAEYADDRAYIVQAEAEKVAGA